MELLPKPRRPSLAMPPPLHADDGVDLGTELLADKLFWAPRMGAKNVTVLAALDLCWDGSQLGEAGSKYVVRHYAPDAVGKAFGPLGLDSILRFCRGLDAKLRGAHAVAILSPESKDDRTNSAVLVGAYLLLRQDWTCTRVVEALGSELGDLPFTCSWAQGEQVPPVMNVHDCWLGLELAAKLDWLDTTSLKDDDKTDVAIERWLHLLLAYDASWLVPGAIMVAADPTTTIYDPCPSTCTSLFPQNHISPPDSLEKTGTCDHSQVNSGQAEAGRRGSFNSVETVCKEYIDSSTCVPSSEGSAQLTADLDFVTFMQSCNVGMVVRANFDREPGMPTASYGDTAFEAYGIAQVNVRVVDEHGGVPRPRDILRCLDECAGTTPDEGGAVLIHCKGGFGRSVVLACCLAIDRLDVPGRALLGWIRMVRPGSITTRSQELFLKKLRGRGDVKSHVRFAEGQAACGPGCMVQ